MTLKRLRLKIKKSVIIKLTQNILFVFGSIFIVLIILSFTDIPFYAYHKLGVSAGKLKEDPEIIIVLGGAGMPSPDGLMRMYYAAEAAHKWDSSKIIIAHPFQPGNDSLFQLKLLENELIMRDIDSTRIFFEPNGRNTWYQAYNIVNHFIEFKNDIPVLIITSPEHMYRSVMSFKKAGVKKIGGIPAFEKPIDEKSLINDLPLKKTALDIRYNMWSYLHYEILVIREYSAICYYKIRGWI